MERKEFARKVARSQNLPIARAQDQVDEIFDRLGSRFDELAAKAREDLDANPARKGKMVADIRAVASRIARSRRDRS